jgi:nucleotide-binding universal stress UspA family protein
LAAAAGGQLIVLYVNDPLLDAAAAAAAYDTKAIARQTDTELKRFCGKALDGSKLPARNIRYAVVFGNAAPEIVEAADSMGADLIVMGTRGLSGATRLVLGSTTEHVLRKAGVPVLAVPPGVKTRRRAVRQGR